MSEDRARAIEARNAALIADQAAKLGTNPDNLKIVLGCDFCGKTQDRVYTLIAGRALLPDIDVHICNECVCVCVDVLAQTPDQ
jgi:hypothetical protein